jgi:hypothetical protein
MLITFSAISPTLSGKKCYHHLLIFIILVFSIDNPIIIHRKRDYSLVQYATRTTTVSAWQMSDCMDRTRYHRKRMVSYGFRKDSMRWMQQWKHLNHIFRLHSQIPHHEDYGSVIDLYDANVTGGCVKNTANHIRLLDKS